MKKRSSVRYKIESVLKRNPKGLSVSDIVQKTRVSRSRVLEVLNELKKENKLGVKTENSRDKKKSMVNRDVKVKAKKVKTVGEFKEKEDKKSLVKEIKKEAIKNLKAGANVKTKERKEKKGKVKLRNILNKNKVRKVKRGAERGPEDKKEFIFTGIEGLDALFSDGIPKGYSILVAGGAGSGKTVMGLQILAHHASKGKNCLYMSFEESEERLIDHMRSFGWNPDRYLKKGNLIIKRFNPFDITRNVDALLMKAKGELLIDVKPVIFPKGFNPDIIVVDSLTAIASAFSGKDESYRIYIEQLFRFFEQIDATSFLITETEQIPRIFSPTGVEEFLADGVVVLYNIKRTNVRERALEILKLRGAAHEKRMVAFQITGKGIEVYPEQQVFGGVEEEA
jgi:circadian clock protein KaiC